MSHRRLPLFAFILSVSGVVVACSASGDSTPDLSETPGAIEQPPGAVLPPPGKPMPPPAPDHADAGKDSGKPKPPGHDASVDAGPPPPVVGAKCANADEIYSRPCGACGTQEAICLKADPSDPMGTVSEYSACQRELEGGCVPGTIVDEACGNCGTHKKTCSKYCAWSATACAGEPVNSCSAGTVLWTNAGCAAGTFRNKGCSATCQWDGFKGCSAPDFAVTVPAAIGGTSTVIVQLTTAYQSKRVTGSCTAPAGATVSTTDKHNIAFVRVENPSAQNATVSAWNAQAAGGPIVNTVLVSYATQPTNDDELRACEKGAGDYCPTAKLPCGDAKFGALTDTSALVIPAGGSRVVAITSYSPQGTPGDVTEGQIALSVRTDALE